MSRTYRRKNYELQHPLGSHGCFKVAGYYTQYDYVRDPNSTYGHNALCVYREPTKEERKYMYLCIHTCKKFAYFAGITKEFRQIEQRIYRRRCKRVLDNLTLDDLEAVLPAFEKNQSWYW